MGPCGPILSTVYFTFGFSLVCTQQIANEPGVSVGTIKKGKATHGFLETLYPIDEIFFVSIPLDSVAFCV